MTATVGAPARVDVWISPEGELTAVLLDAYRAWMSPDEARQSQRFLREEDRQRYLLTRGLARGVLAGYTGETPSALAFATQEFGKPARIDQQFKDVRIRNVPTNIRSYYGSAETERHGNSIFIFEIANLCIVHLGHLHHTLTQQQLNEIGRPDIVLVPVDGS